MNDSCCKVTFQCEDIKTVAQLIEPKDDLVTVDMKNTVQALKYPSAHAVTPYMPGFKAIN